MVSILLPLVFCLFTLFSQLSAAGTLSRRQDAPPSAPYASTFSIPLDHFNTSDTRTFSNRYWMNGTYYQPGGPIFMFDAGEAGLSDSAAQNALNSSTTIFAPLELAKKYHGIAIMWEHRFYGQSMPFPVDNATGVALAGYDAYKYLNNEQALEDAVYFAKNFQPRGYSKEEAEGMRGDRAPWIWIGGSYPGTRAAIIRERNPDVFFASWASSAPVQAQVEMPMYYTPIYQNMPKNCSADIHATVTYADAILTNGTEEEVELLKKAVFFMNSANPRNATFAVSADELSYWNVSRILSYPFQSSFFNFQTFGFEQSLATFCNQLETWNPSNSTPFTSSSSLSDLFTNDLSRSPTPSGLAATSGANGAQNAFYAYLYAVIQKSIQDYKMFPQNPRTLPDGASWDWQLCTQFAQFQVSSFPSNQSLISRFYNITNHEDWFCHASFPYAPPKPDVGAILKYGGWGMKPSNVMFTNGELDPFRTLSVQSITKTNPEAPNRPSTQEVPKCGIPPNGEQVFGNVWDGQVHASDLETRNSTFVGSPVEMALELFEKALDEWLPCFGKGKRV